MSEEFDPDRFGLDELDTDEVIISTKGDRGIFHLPDAETPEVACCFNGPAEENSRSVPAAAIVPHRRVCRDCIGVDPTPTSPSDFDHYNALLAAAEERNGGSA